MRIFFWFIILFFNSFAIAQHGIHGPQQQMPNIPQQQMPNIPQQQMPKTPQIGVPRGEDSEPNVGMPPVNFPPSSETMMGKPVEGLSARDPFRLPEELVIKIRQKNAAVVTASSSNGIDPTVEEIRRYPLATYQLVGIIWDVRKPKAMFRDLSLKIHVVQVNDFIGNAKGVITSIQSGAVTVLEGKIPQIIKLKK